MATAVRQFASLLLLIQVCWPTAVRGEEAIVVFGSAVRPDGTPSPVLQRRLETALSVARNRPRAKVVVSGGSSAGPAEGPMMARWLGDRGIQARRLRVEARARHTGENARLVIPLLQRDQINKVTLVTGQSHMRRARFHLRWALREAGLGHVAVRSHAAPEGLRGLGRIRVWCRESVKLVRDAAFNVRDRLKTRRATQIRVSR